MSEILVTPIEAGGEMDDEQGLALPVGQNALQRKCVISDTATGTSSLILDSFSHAKCASFAETNRKRSLLLRSTRTDCCVASRRPFLHRLVITDDV